MNRVLITGENGFIGSHLVKTLQGKWSVTAVNRSDGDIRDEETWRLFPDVDVVIHLADKNSTIESWDYPADYIKSNVQSVTNALEYCRKKNSRFVYLSSYLYGDAGDMPIDEAFPIIASNPYSFSKLIAEKICDYYVNNFKIAATIIRPFNVYGYGQSKNFLLPSIIASCLNQETNEIYVEDLAPKRDYIYIDDLTNLIEKCLEITSGINIFNAGSGVSYSVQEVIALIQEITKVNKKVVSKNNVRPNEINNCISNISLARRNLCWSPKWDLMAGLTRMIDEQLKND